MSDVPDRVTKRVNLACHYCRRRKKKCNGTRPTCSNCAAAGEQCVYQVRSAPSKSNIRFDMLMSQMNRMEKMLSKLAEEHDNFKPPVSDYDSSAYSVPSTGGDEPLSHEEDINQVTLEESLDEEPLGELPDFNDRLEQLMSHQMAGYFDSLVYMSGLFMSLFSPNEVERLSRKMHNSQLLNWFTKTSNRIWRLQQSTMMRLVDITDGELDPEFAIFCIDIHRQNLAEINIRCQRLRSKEQMAPNLISYEDIDPDQYKKWSPSLRRGINAALVIEGIITLRMSRTPISHPWNQDFMEEQLKVAFHNSVDLLNLMRFSRPSYMMAKTCTFIMIHISRYFCIPSIYIFTEPLLEFARALALDNEAINSKLPAEKATERKKLSSILSRYQTQQMICRLALSKPADISYSKSRESTLDFDETPKAIYLRCRKMFFGLYKSRGSSRIEIYKEIVRSNYELEEWWKTTSEMFGVKSPSSSSSSSSSSPHIPKVNASYSSITSEASGTDYIESFIHSNESMHRLEYYMTKLIIYTIPAFYPEYLPYEIPGALDTVTHTAHKLLALAISETRDVGVCYYGMTLCTTAALGALLYKQLKYPNHPSNRHDIDVVKQGLPRLNAKSWPSAVGGHNPMMELWQALLHIMVKLYEVNQLENSENTGPATPGSESDSSSTDTRKPDHTHPGSANMDHSMKPNSMNPRMNHSINTANMTPTSINVGMNPSLNHSSLNASSMSQDINFHVNNGSNTIHSSVTQPSISHSDFTGINSSGTMLSSSLSYNHPSIHVVDTDDHQQIQMESGQNMYEFENILDENSDMLMSDIERADNCVIS